IPVMLVYFVSNKSDLVFPRIFWLFGAFIFACGTVHLIEATIFWQPWYRLSGFVKAITAVVSWATVLCLIPIMPKALKLPGLAKLTEELQVANNLLSDENASRRKTERDLNEAKQQLEQKN